MIEQSSTLVKEEEAVRCLDRLRRAPINPAMKTSTSLCLRRWDQATQKSVLTLILLVSGTEEDGTSFFWWLVVGSRVILTNRHGPSRSSTSM